MFSRLSSIFNLNEEPNPNPKPDNAQVLKDLLLQIKSLSTSEKQLIKEALEESITVSAPTDVVISEQELIVPEQSVQTTTQTSTPSYEYKETEYKRRKD